MRIVFFNQIKISKLDLPQKIDGSFWVLDEFNKNSNIINIESRDNAWFLKSNPDAKIVFNGSEISELKLDSNVFCKVLYNNKENFLYVENKYDDTIKYYSINNNEAITLGQDAGNVTYSNPNIFNDYMTLQFLGNGLWKISIKQNSKVYINDYLLKYYSKLVNSGDIIYIYGLRIGLYNGMFSINNISNSVKVGNNFKVKDFKKLDVGDNVPDSEDIKEIDLYNEEDYFYKKPRLRRFIKEYDLNLTAPPSKNKEEEMPALLVLGPMLGMALTSGITLFNAILSIFKDKSTFVSQLPSLLTSTVMILGTFLWPNLTKRYQKKKRKRLEKEHLEKYLKYLDKKRKEVFDVSVEQSQILKENLISLEECENIILKNKRELWERGVDQQDFLTVRLGIGEVPLKININFTEEDFSMEDDDLKDMVKDFVKESKIIKNVPVGFSFYNKDVVAVMGNLSETNYFMDNVLLQLLAFHSFDELKIVFLISNKNEEMWNKYKEIPHCFSNNKEVRFFATNIDDIKYVSSFLEREYVSRANGESDSQIVSKESDQDSESTFSPYYLIITDDYPMIRNVGIVDLLLKNKLNLGFSMICVENRLSRLPSECTNFISITGKNGSILTTDLNNYTNQIFDKEIKTNINMAKCCEKISNIPIEFSEDIRNLPPMLGFMEMYNVGKVEQLNSLNRWRINDPIKSLRAQIGINDEGNPIYLDLHEKYHGPHGLIAGTTGSGKSEFIITYILSMIINYSPNEVAFILIDYKGGGLAGAFENKTQNIRLPHLAGTITNLDKASLNRTLVSINSELQRRQKVFNEARDKLGESTIDIYKYQRFFREKKLDEPMPHLFIISDEFAELKSQQPEFMADLISAARIGRSLGVHLILATQKPSGVVNDQIWSNTKFRVCLKVQDQSDSNEMLKKPDAADITNAGRFYLQVGHDEIYVLGQSGWAGTKYQPSDSVKKNYDRSISIIDNVGNVIKNISELQSVKQDNDIGDELSNILKYIVEVAKKGNMVAKNLWLDSIPEKIIIEDLIKKYNFTKSEDVVAILGEYDDPEAQKQGLLSLKLDHEGNSLIYSVSSTDRELLISSIVYSLCTMNSVSDINIYIVDCGSESLKSLSKFPQVGDVAVVAEGDKINKLIDIVNEEMIQRKKLFANFNGDYKTYCKSSGKKIPIKLIIINNYDAFKEAYAILDERLSIITRECSRYGILFILSGNNYRSITSRITDNFYHKYVLTMNDREDYYALVGKMGNLYPAEYEGRGVFSEEKILEFQTARMYDGESLFDFIEEKSTQIRQREKVEAPKIPVLPEEVTMDMLESYMTDIKNLPIGINKSNLKVETYNFCEDKANIIVAKKIEYTINLLKTIITGAKKTKNFTVLIDAEKQLTEIGGEVDTYVDDNFEKFIVQFEQFLDNEIEGKNVKLLCIISGIEKFQKSLDNNKFRGFFNGIKSVDNLNIIFAEYSHKLKKLGFEDWYSSIVNKENGIWVGPGFAEQNVIATSAVKIEEEKDTRYAWVVKYGEFSKIKCIGVEEKEDEK